MKTTPIVLASVVSVVLAMATPANAQSGGYALRFDGATDLVRLHATASMMGPAWPTTKTVSLWVNPTGSSVCTRVDAASCDLVFGDSPRTWGISRGTINGQDRIWVWNQDGNFDQVGISYQPGVWMQVALVHDNGVLSAYANGEFVGSVLSGTTSQGPGQSLVFGGLISNATRNWTFEGEIDEVQVWNVARSGAEIAASVSGPLVGNEPGLAAYYRMTEGSGTAVSDDSGHGWTGSLMDGGTGVPGNGPIAWVASGAFGGEPPTPNTPPTADPKDIQTLEDTPVPVTLTGTDADEDPLTFRVTVSPTFGALTGTAPDLVYVPMANFNGVDSFTFVANDGRIDSAPAGVTITVLAVNDPPAANDDAATTAIDTMATIAVLDNDVDVDGDVLTVSAVTQPVNGGVVTNEVAYVAYTPPAGFFGTDTFTYTASDGHGGFATVAVTVTVTPTGADPGLALRFDGASDYMALAKTTQVMAPGWQNRKTVSLWVKPEGTPYCSVQSHASCDVIFGDAPRWWGISRGIIGGLDRIWVWNFTATGLQSVAVPYTVGQWMHIALVHDNGVLYAFKNGLLAGAIASGATLQPNLPTALPTLYIGGIITNATRNWTFQGDIDEVQIWNAARTVEQIRQDMQWPLSGAEPDLAAYYRMSDGAGTLVTDDSGHGWTGSIVDGKGEVPPDGPALWVPSGAFSVPPPQ